ncbi:Mob1/phocein family protein [Calycina marina]|uniref:Mob1/phocein family protein n=1 Tax=Calycina marina TaxID=1763456 RepID=A0A9P7Z9V4_9HELO|nr:Mob1/phocein family protein [Calycina marina]
MSLAPSSPRLPSPPPPTEVQVLPNSPAATGNSTQEASMEQAMIDANSSRRIHPGTKSADMEAGPPLVPLLELDSAFQLQEHLKALHFDCTKPVDDSGGVVPINHKTALTIATPPDGVDKSLWLYELCRFVINKCNDLIVGFLFDDPPCSASTCPEMRASEWQFLCAVHESPKSCCAIDYCCHTLDWAANIVTSQTIFPSRLSLGPGSSDTGVKHLVNIFRRVYRIFLHAWFQHRDVFYRIEMQTGIYVLFKMICDSYDLLPAENYKLPPEAEGLEPIQEVKTATPSILKPAIASPPKPSSEEPYLSSGNVGSIGRMHTRRHIRQSPSVGSAVTTVLESEDEEEPKLAKKLGNLHIAEGAEAEEDGVTEIPVIVEMNEIDGDQENDPASPVHEEVKPEPEPTEHEEVEEGNSSSTEISPPNSTSSWDRMSSESLEDKSEAPEKNYVDAIADGQDEPSIEKEEEVETEKSAVEHLREKPAMKASDDDNENPKTEVEPTEATTTEK